MMYIRCTNTHTYVQMHSIRTHMCRGSVGGARAGLSGDGSWLPGLTHPAPATPRLVPVPWPRADRGPTATPSDTPQTQTLLTRRVSL